MEGGRVRAHVLVIRSAPDTREAERALDLARTWLGQNDAVAVALIQDEVLVALGAGDLHAQRRFRDVVQAGARCAYLAADLEQRGFGPEDALPGCELTDHGGLVDLLLADGTRVVGAF
jgi:hypothetical protein